LPPLGRFEISIENLIFDLFTGWIMQMKMGVIVIGSLFWDPSEVRRNWRTHLATDERHQIALPIRYGRKSRIDGERKGTFTMIFSSSLQKHQYGKCLLIPFKENFTSQAEFQRQALHLAEAEGISSEVISKPWGTVSLVINPSSGKHELIQKFWSELVTNIPERSRPNISGFGEDNEDKSIRDNLQLNLQLDEIFKKYPHFDALFAASNAVKLDEHGRNRYATLNAIAAEIYQSGYYEYFLKNRLNGITTFQDKKIARILKRRYKVSLKSKMAKLKTS
jgi:hypothetical protein